MRIFTIGHSTHSFEEFLALLREFNIRVLADIRRFPGSRRFPQFNSATLRDLLAEADIGYMWFEALGGRRHGLPKDQSPNTLLRSPGFRNYADYMLTEEFSGAIHELLTAASDSTTAIMCAEKLYWKCHRRLVSDHLVAQGVRVEHILGPGDLRSHELTDGAVINEEKKVIYPSAQADQLEFGA